MTTAKKTPTKKRGDTKSRTGRRSTSTISRIGTGLTMQRTEDVAYVIAITKVHDSQEYQTLKKVCKDPFQSDENYQWIINFIERRATKFWRYLQFRESGKKDKDMIRAASVLEYCRLLSDL